MYGVGKTDKGKIREKNEDSIFVSNEPMGSLSTIYIVADGMGGHNAGEVASEHSINYFCNYARENNFEDGDLMDFLISGVCFANEKVFEKSKEDKKFKGMGTTFSACLLEKNKLYISHVGDSRVYKINKDEIIQLTSDHTYVNEMVKSGQISKEEALHHPNKNVVTRALGVADILFVDGSLENISNDDKILICSDGLTNMLSDEKILQLVNKSNNLSETVDILIESANENGGDDNISVILIGKEGEDNEA